MARVQTVKTEKDWQAESDLNTLIEAEKIRRDKKGRLKAAMTKKREMQKALEKVEG